MTLNRSEANRSGISLFLNPSMSRRAASQPWDRPGPSPTAVLSNCSRSRIDGWRDMRRRGSRAASLCGWSCSVGPFRVVGSGWYEESRGGLRMLHEEAADQIMPVAYPCRLHLVGSQHQTSILDPASRQDEVPARDPEPVAAEC